MDERLPFPSSGDLSRKVISIAAGESHSLALSGDGYVYSWGRGIFGRLGTGSESDQLSPVRIGFDFPGKPEGQRLKIVGVAAGAYHSLALADDGSIWCWGYNTYGQLGFDGENSVVPRLMDQFLETDIKIHLKVCSVKAGGMMSLAIDSIGSLWMWGNIPQQSSEPDIHPSLTSISTPIPIQDFQGHTVVKVACGSEHIVALVTVGETYKDDEELVLYSWGDNRHGQLGLGDREVRFRPQVVEILNKDSPWAVYEIACGAFHTALLTRKKETDGTQETGCWTFGLGDNGQLGHGTTQSSSVPQIVKELPRDVHFASVDCGMCHTSVVSSNGDVWSWGMQRGLGLCPGTFTDTETGDALVPLQVNGSSGLKFQDPVQIACGAAHTVLVAHDGYELWSWGRGRSGVLGSGNEIDRYAPAPVLWPLYEKETVKEEVKDGDTDKRLSEAMEEIKSLQSKLSVMDRYTSLLHGSIFGKPFDGIEDIPVPVRNSVYYDVAKDWESMLENADRSTLVRLEGFYRNMLARVKDKLLQRRIQEIVKDSLHSSTTRS